MITLFLDTSLSNLIVAIAKDDKVLVHKNLFLIKNHSEHATTTIKAAFKEVNLKFDDIDQIMVVNGPGSFTGIRIGVTIAKTMAYLLNKPIIPINSLTMRAISIEAPIKAAQIDARRDHVYGAIYGSNMNELLKPQYISQENFNKELTKHKEYKLAIEETEIDILKVINYYKDQKPVNPHKLNPDYHKKTEVEEKREQHD